ncbi:hypothetical protein Poli38472_007990 [Pythium oligandrum]|uniref:AGC protein kinase n=1 Tax=Pythium oligandrum TaxID=41045 RepID=A0A8K1CN57_PYTOL|nr:hypothetical protein Poli38472_007990 [Pythium oligandrum]|eukprot:TMW65348.1 hypothetical protein Poli38472_007990 [Pythium oligandrum]
MRSTQSFKRESSTEESVALVDRLIQKIQRQMRDELGFKEIIITTGEEADETTTMGGMRGSMVDTTFNFARRHSMNLNTPDDTRTMSSSTAASSLASDAEEEMNRLRKGYLSGLGPRNTSETSSDASHCSDCARGTVFVSPNFESKPRVLVIVPYREAGIWSRSITMQQQSSNDTSGSMMAYLKKAVAENYGVVIMNPAAQYCHPNRHVEQAWDELVAPLSSDIYVIAFSRGAQYVKHLIAYDNGQGVMQDRLKALALVEPSHYVSDSDCYFARRMLARRAVAWILSNDIDVGCRMNKAESRHGCICISAGTVPMSVTGSSGAWALEMVMSSVFGSFAARSGEAAGITVNDGRISSCGICYRKLGVLNRRIPCSWCEVKYCSRCCEDKFVPQFGSWRVCSLCQVLPCLIDPRRKDRAAKNHKSPTGHETFDRYSVFIQPKDGEPVSLSDFEIIKLIGRGACGRVKLVRKKHGSDEGSLYAMKAIKKKLVIQRGLVEATNAERRILDRINHPYVATLCYAMQTDAKLYLLSKYYPGGNLLDQMRLARRFPEDRTRLYAAEVALAIHHLHQNNIIYRDLKLENVLVGSDGHVALTDFGMSKENMGIDGRTSTFVGTYQMMAPEVFTGKSYSRMVDWWALGVMVYEMIDGRTPFNAKTNKLIKERITNVDLKFSPRFTEDARDFVSRLLTKSEHDRLGAGPHGFEHIKRHPWFRGIDWERVGRVEEKYDGQDDLKKAHAREFSTADIFDTYMNTVEVPIDTPASVKSSSDNLFNDFEFNAFDERLSEPEMESPAGDGVFELELLGDEERAQLIQEQKARASAVLEATEGVEGLERLVTSHESHFDISLLRPQQATDFEYSAVSSLSSESNSTEEDVQQVDVENIADNLLVGDAVPRAEEVLSDDEDDTPVQGKETPSSPTASSPLSVSEPVGLTKSEELAVEVTVGGHP